MKKTLVLSIALLILAGTLFAEGSRESDNTADRPGPQERPAPQGQPEFETEEETLTGILDLSGYGPVLNVGDESYLLMVPRVLPEGIEVEDGDEITVTGFVHEAPPMGRRSFEEAENRMVIGVTKVVIDGEEFEIPRGPFQDGDVCPYCGRPYDNGYGGRGSRGGRTGGGWGMMRPPRPGYGRF